MIVSDVQQRDSAIHIQISILPQTPFPSTLPCNIEQSSIYSTVDQLATFNLISYCVKTNQLISIWLGHHEFNFLLCVAEPAYEMTQEDSCLNCWQCVLGLLQNLAHLRHKRKDVQSMSVYWEVLMTSCSLQEVL